MVTSHSSGAGSGVLAATVLLAGCSSARARTHTGAGGRRTTSSSPGTGSATVAGCPSGGPTGTRPGSAGTTCRSSGGTTATRARRTSATRWSAYGLTALDGAALAVTSGAAFTVDGQPARRRHGRADQPQRRRHLAADHPRRLLRRRDRLGPAHGDGGQHRRRPGQRPHPHADRLCAPEARTYRGALGARLGRQHPAHGQHPVHGGLPARRRPPGVARRPGAMPPTARGSTRSWRRPSPRGPTRGARTATPYAQTCDTTTCQVYGGAGLNGASHRGPAHRPRRRQHHRRRHDARRAGRAHRVPLVQRRVHGRRHVPRRAGRRRRRLAVPRLVGGRRRGRPSPRRSAWARCRAITVLTRNGLGADGGRVLTVRVTGTGASVVVSGERVPHGAGPAVGLVHAAVPPPSTPARDDISPVARRGGPHAAGTVLAFVRGTDGGAVGHHGDERGVRRRSARSRPGRSAGPAAVSADGSRMRPVRGRHRPRPVAHRPRSSTRRAADDVLRRGRASGGG